jgi:hypothetical protein
MFLMFSTTLINNSIAALSNGMQKMFMQQETRPYSHLGSVVGGQWASAYM